MTGRGPRFENATGGRFLDVIALAVLAVVAVLGIAGFVATGLRMPAHATVGGVDVGGRSPQEARAALERELGPRMQSPISVVHDNHLFTIDPVQAGLTVDLDASLRSVGGFPSLNPVRMVRLLAGRVSKPLVVSADSARLASAIASVAARVDRPPVEPMVTFDGTKPQIRQPRSGVVVDRAATATAIRRAYLVADRVDLPMQATDPVIGRRALDEALKRIVEPALSGPVTVIVGGERISLPVSAYTPALSVRADGDVLRPHLDPQALAEPLTSATTGISKDAVNARVVIRRGKPVVIPARPGVGLRPAEMAVKLLAAITRTGAARSVSVESKVVPPTFTTDDAKQLNITEKISEFVTYFPSAHYRNVNQSRAAAAIDGTLLKPGDTFSLNRTVGERSPENGFVKGIVIGEGAVYDEQYGGGVSQVATTVYNAAFFAGLEDVEHHPHLFYIQRYPLGREATVWYGQLDLRFKNTLANGILIRAWVVKGSATRRGEMHVQMWGTKQWDVTSSLSSRYNERDPGRRYNDTDECIEQPPTEGFDVDVTRTFRRPGSAEVVKTDKTHVSYAAGDEVICGPAPVPATTATPTTTPAYAR